MSKHSTVVEKPVSRAKHAKRHPAAKSQNLTDLMASLGIPPASATGTDNTNDGTGQPSDAIIREVANYTIQAAEAAGVTGPSAKPVFDMLAPGNIKNPTAEHVLEFGKLLVALGDPKDLPESYKAMSPKFVQVGTWLQTLGQTGGATGKDRSPLYTDGKPINSKNGGPQAGWEMGQFLLSLVAKTSAGDDDLPIGGDIDDLSGEADDASDDAPADL